MKNEIVIDQQAYYSRVEGIVSWAFHRKGVLCVGTGAGSYMIEKLARLGPGLIRAVDLDVVDVPNLPRTCFDVADLGCYKAEQLTEKIKAANPFVKVEALVGNLCEMSESQLASLCQDIDLIVAGTDQFQAQAVLNELSVRFQIPTVFIGIHAGGLGGLVVWVIPGETPCYRCVAKERYDAFEQSGEEETNLAGERGSIVDCQFIDMVALKVCAAILDRGQDSRVGRFFEKMGKRTQIIIRADPDYLFGETDIFDLVLDDLPQNPKDYKRELKEQVFFAMDSIWLHTDFDPECPVCGGIAHVH